MKKQLVILALCTAVTTSFGATAAFAKHGRSHAEDSKHRSNDDGGVRGNGTIDDNRGGRHNGADDVVNGVKVRGDGSVDDNGVSHHRRRGR